MRNATQTNALAVPAGERCTQVGRLRCPSGAFLPAIKPLFRGNSGASFRKRSHRVLALEPSKSEVRSLIRRVCMNQRSPALQHNPSSGFEGSVRRAGCLAHAGWPLSTNGEQVGDYHHKFEGGKVVPVVVTPPQAHRELQGKQNKTKQADLIIRGPLLGPMPAALLFNKTRRTSPGLEWYAPLLDSPRFRFSN